MNQLDSLTGYLKNALGERVFKTCEIYSDDTQVRLAVKNIGLEQIRIGVCSYNATFIFYDWSYRELAPGLLPALVLAWIIDHGNTEIREQLSLSDPTISRDQSENGRSLILTLEIDLFDEVIIIPDDNGRISYDNQLWRLTDPQIWTAENIATEARLS